MSARLVFPLVLAAAMFAVSPASGADDDVPFDYGKLVQQLDADAFGDRQRASEQLSAAGKRALPDLKKAALGDSREASTRALHILRNHFRTGSDDLKAAAKSALQELAQSDKSRVAREAEETLKPPAPAVPFNQPQQRIRIGGAQIQVQVIGQANGRRIQFKNVNGVKEINAEENGQKVKIVDDPAKGIKMEITKKKDGKQTTEKISVKNAAELKKKHPAAHKLYEKYSKNRRPVQLKALQVKPGRIQLVPRRIAPKLKPQPPGQKPQNADPDQVFKQIQAELERAIKEVEKNGPPKEIIEQLEKLKKQIDVPPAKPKE